MRWVWLRGVVPLVSVLMAPTVLVTAQETQGSPEPFHVNDSVVVAVVAQVIVEKSAHLFVRAALDGTQVPFQITLPEGATSHQWQALLDHLMVSLRGRSLQTPDNLQYAIDVRGLELGVGTMRIGLQVGVRSRCRDYWIMNGVSYEVSWVSLGNDHNWSQMKTEMLIHDHGLCPADPE